ncbi:MAG: ferredoxin-thioredoxin reductase catalytic domain-containing protein [Candidatus Xenobia bacterium]
MKKPEPSPEHVEKMWNYFHKYCEKSGTTGHPDREVTESVITGLAANIDEVGRPLCPCNFYADKKAEVEKREWICACDEMQIFKYCHCIFFVTPEGMPITEYLPEWHEGRQTYGLVKDPTPDKGRALRHRAEEWIKAHQPKAE